MEVYAVAELPAARFHRGCRFRRIQAIDLHLFARRLGRGSGERIHGARLVPGCRSEPPDWTVQTIPAGQTVTITVPGTAANWQVDFYDTSTGTTILSSASVTRYGSTVTVTLPDFQDDVAFKMMAGAGTSVITPEVAVNTDEIAGTWSGTFSRTRPGLFRRRSNYPSSPIAKPAIFAGLLLLPNCPALEISF